MITKANICEVTCLPRAARRRLVVRVLVVDGGPDVDQVGGRGIGSVAQLRLHRPLCGKKEDHSTYSIFFIEGYQISHRLPLSHHRCSLRIRPDNRLEARRHNAIGDRDRSHRICCLKCRK